MNELTIKIMTLLFNESKKKDPGSLNGVKSNNYFIINEREN
jgi:hypothetical protein